MNSTKLENNIIFLTRMVKNVTMNNSTNIKIDNISKIEKSKTRHILKYKQNSTFTNFTKFL